MRAIALTTTRLHAVDPRSFYLDSLDEPEVPTRRVCASASP